MDNKEKDDLIEQWRGIPVQSAGKAVGKVEKMVKMPDGTLQAELRIDDEEFMDHVRAGGLIGGGGTKSLKAQRAEMYSKIKVLGLPCRDPAPNPEPLIREMLIREGIWPEPLRSRFAKVTVPLRNPDAEPQVREMLESTHLWGADDMPIGTVTVYEHPDVPEAERYPDDPPRQLH